MQHGLSSADYPAPKNGYQIVEQGEINDPTISAIPYNAANRDALCTIHNPQR